MVGGRATKRIKRIAVAEILTFQSKRTHGGQSEKLREKSFGPRLPPHEETRTED